MAEDEPLDIFTRIHRRIRDVLRGYGPFADLVQGANHVDVTDLSFEEFKPNVGPDDTPEVVILQAEYTQARFAPSDASAHRTQAFPVVITGGSLRPVLVNRVKEAMLDALCDAGAKLGLADYHVVGWGVSGRDALTAEQQAPGHESDRRAFRFQSLGTVTVEWLKPLRRRL